MVTGAPVPGMGGAGEALGAGQVGLCVDKQGPSGEVASKLRLHSLGIANRRSGVTGPRGTCGLGHTQLGPALPPTASQSPSRRDGAHNLPLLRLPWERPIPVVARSPGGPRRSLPVLQSPTCPSQADLPFMWGQWQVGRAGWGDPVEALSVVSWVI